MKQRTLLILLAALLLISAVVISLLTVQLIRLRRQTEQQAHEMQARLEAQTDHKLYTAEGFTQNANVYMRDALCYYGKQFRFTIVNNTRHSIHFEIGRLSIDHWNGNAWEPLDVDLSYYESYALCAGFSSSSFSVECKKITVYEDGTMWEDENYEVPEGLYRLVMHTDSFDVVGYASYPNGLTN